MSTGATGATGVPDKIRLALIRSSGRRVVRFVFTPPLLRQLGGPHLNGVSNPRLKIEGDVKKGMNLSLTGHSSGYGIYTSGRDDEGKPRELESRVAPKNLSASETLGVPSFWWPVKIDVKDGVPILHIGPVPALSGDAPAPAPSNPGAEKRMTHGIVNVSGKDHDTIVQAQTAGVGDHLRMQQNALRTSAVVGRLDKATDEERRALHEDMTKPSKDNVITVAKPPLNPALPHRPGMDYFKQRVEGQKPPPKPATPATPPKLGGEEKRVATVPVKEPPTQPPPHVASAAMKEPDLTADKPVPVQDIKELVAMVNDELAKHQKGAITLVIRPDGTLGAKVRRQKVVVTYEEEYL